MALPRFFRKKIYLDTLFSRKTNETSNHVVGSSFKAFAVIGSNQKEFSLSLCPDPVNGSINSIPLRDAFFHNFKTIPNNAVFENSVVQPGAWVEVLFSTEDELTNNPASPKVVTTTVELGFSRGELDGLTRQVQFSWNSAAGTSVVRDTEKSSYNNGSYNANSIAFYNEFKVPPGYIATVLACELSIVTGVTVGTTLRLAAISNGTVYTDAGLNDSNEIGILALNPSSFTVGDYKARLLVAQPNPGSKYTDRDGIILYENEIPVIVAKGTPPSAGVVTGFLLIRLQPKPVST